MSNFICFKAEWLSNDQDRADIITAYLSEFPFTHFENEGQWLKAFADEHDIAENEYEGIEEAVMDYCDRIEWSIVERENWNEMWEKNFFDPLQVGQFYVRATFHPEAPEGVRAITIEPRMSFGTGHHETTHMMIQHLLETDINQKKTLDMGCGTAILAILAEMKGAQPIDAIDIDNWCYLNSIENITRNDCKAISVFEGDANLLHGKKYDLIIANINRNILLNDMQQYVDCLNKNGILLLSGFYKEDITIINQSCTEKGLSIVKKLERNNWVALKYVN